nr:MAG TPA: hypothetical protein [Caudoviricetes sp.]
MQHVNYLLTVIVKFLVNYCTFMVNPFKNNNLN